MSDIKRQLDNLLDAQPYRQDYFDGIVQAFEKLEEERDRLRAALRRINEWSTLGSETLILREVQIYAAEASKEPPR